MYKMSQMLSRSYGMRFLSSLQKVSSHYLSENRNAHLVETEKLKTVLYDQKYEGLEDMPAALQDMWDRKAWGKAIIKIPSDGKL